MAGKALKLNQKIHIARLLDQIGICRIEAGIPAMGGEEKKSVEKIAALGLKSKISSWNRLNVRDIEMSMECGVDLIQLSVPSSDIQIARKLNNTREWVVDHLRRCIELCNEKGFPAAIGLEDASRAERDFLFRLIDCAVSEGVRVVRYADTVGILSRSKAYEDICAINAKYELQLEMHAHNDFGMAVANSIAAAKAGAELIDCTAGGIGERCGNCNMLDFMKAAGEFIDGCDFELDKVEEVQKQILHIINGS